MKRLAIGKLDNDISCHEEPPFININDLSALTFRLHLLDSKVNMATNSRGELVDRRVSHGAGQHAARLAVEVDIACAKEVVGASSKVQVPFCLDECFLGRVYIFGDVDVDNGDFIGA